MPYSLTNKILPRWSHSATLVLFFALAFTAFAQRQMERLGRGVVALHSATSQAYIGWRLLATDPSDAGFNIYRSSSGAPGVKLNSLPLTNTTDYVDSTANFTVSNAWYVAPIINGVEQSPSAARGLAANSPVRQYLSWPLRAVTNAGAPFDVKFCWVGDFDGDGEYDYLVDRISTVTATNEYLQAYKSDGTFLWQMDMGYNSTNQYNIEPGSSAISIGDKDNVTVYDLDGDGRAEVCVRIARGVIMPNGSTATGPDDTTQYLSIIDALTGNELARTTITNLWPADGPLNSHFGIMYCDGVRPSLLIRGENRTAGGSFQRETMTYDYRNGQLTRRWFHTPANGANESWGHQIRIMDVNHDGIDDLVDVGSVLNGATGELLWDTELGHGDRFHVTDIDPDRPGLEMFSIQQLNPTLLATALIQMQDGKILKKWYSSVITDVGRGIAVDIDPNHRGLEFYSTQPGIFDCKGNQLWASSIWPPEGVWWDADLSRELEDGAGTGALNPVINKFNPSTGAADRLYSIYSDGGGYQVHQAYGGRAAFWGDILGDWREELVLVANDYSELRVYTTKIAATNRLYCLMQNPGYRDQATCKGYYQASYVDYYLGTEMPPPPPPPVSDAKLIWRGDGTNIWNTSTPNWFTNWYYAGNANTNRAPFNPGDTVLFDTTGSNNTAIQLSGSIAPGDVRVHSPKDYTFGGSGSLDGGMRLTKAGAGKLILNGTNNYSGGTLIGEGTFLVNGSVPNSGVTVRGGVWLDGRLGGSGTVGQPVSIFEGAGVSPGQGTNAPGKLTIANNLTLNGRTLNDFDLSDDPIGLSKTNDFLMIAGNLVLKGTNTFVIHSLNTNLAPGGLYTLISYSGFLTGGLSNCAVSGLTGIPYALTNPPGKIALLVKTFRAPASVTWTGGQNGNAWDLLTSTNWLNAAAKDQFAPGDTVKFDNVGVSNLTVNLSGDLNCSGILVDSTNNYIFGGSGAVIGSAGLTKTNSGILTINAANSTFTGKTIIAGGTLVVSELDAIGFPSPLGNPPGGSTNLVLSSNATLRVTSESYTDRGLALNAGTNTIDITNSADQLTMAGIITGTGILQKTGAGTLALNVNNTYTGPTYIRSGSISLGGGTANQYGLGPGPGGNGNTSVTLDNGTLQMYSDSGSYDTVYWNIIVPTNSTGTIYGDDRCNLYGTLIGGGTLNFNVYYVRTELDGNWSAFAGQLNVGTDSGGGDFRIGNTYGYSNAAVNLADYIYAYQLNGNSVTLGAVTGGPLSKMTGTPWIVGGKNTDATYPGSILGNSIKKVGTGTWTLTGDTNTYSGGTTISSGTLQVGNGGITGSVGTGNITNNAILAFNFGDYITDTNFGIISGTGILVKRGSGQFALTKPHTFTGNTVIEAGSVALTNGGAIGSSSNIILYPGALLDVSGSPSGSMTLAGGKMLSGSGSVKGDFNVGANALLSPGTNGTGTLTFSNALSLAATSTNLFEINHSPLTNDAVKVLGTLTSGGTLIISNIGSTALAKGDSFKLFTAVSYNSSFENVVLPPLGAGLGWNTNLLNTSGVLSVVAVTTPMFRTNMIFGSGFVFSGTGGVANADFYLLGSTNLITPVSNWARLATNRFDGAGNFNFTNPFSTNWSQGYYQLLLP